MRSVKRGVAVVVSAGGRPAGVVHEHVEAPELVDDGVDHRPRGLAVAEVDAEPRPSVGQAVGFAAGAHGDGRAGVGEALRDTPPHALGTAGHEHDHAAEIELDGHRGTVPRMAGQPLAVTVDGRRTTITLDRPARRNTLSLDLIRTFVDALDALDDACAVVVVDALGPAFSAGHDLAELSGRDDRFYAELFAVCTDMMLRLHDLPQPVIAEVQGVATAAGCQLVAACDLAVAADTATFATPGVRSGCSARPRWSHSPAPSAASARSRCCSRVSRRRRHRARLGSGEPGGAGRRARRGGRQARRADPALQPAGDRPRQARVLRPDRTCRTRCLRAHATGDCRQRSRRRRPGGHRRIPREAPAGVAG